MVRPPPTRTKQKRRRNEESFTRFAGQSAPAETADLTSVAAGLSSLLKMPWIYILIAGFLEIAWAIGLKYSDGFTRPLATAITVVLMILSFVFLAQGVRTIPVGTGYAVWTGIGAAGTAILGVVLFNEPLSAARVVCLGVVIAGIVGLKLVSP